MKTLITILFFNFLFTSLFCQVQIGQEIDGIAAGDLSGFSVCLSPDGTRLAIGGPSSDINGVNSGYVRILEEYEGEWIQIGEEIVGENAGDWFGYSLSLSNDGRILAVGSPYNGSNGIEAGQVRIFQENDGYWKQLESVINGDAQRDNFGHSISLSLDGSRLAVGAGGSDVHGQNSGMVRIYEEKEGNWTAVGNDIGGEAEEDWSGLSVSLSGDGSKVAIGSPYNIGQTGRAGHVRVFEEINGHWTQKGSDIEGENEGDAFGDAISISTSGNRVAVGAVWNSENEEHSGHVKIFEDNNGNWDQVGMDIEGEGPDNLCGNSVSLSAAGNRIAISSIWNNANGPGSGHVRIFEGKDNAWIQIGLAIVGEYQFDEFGYCISLSHDGSRLAIGSPYNDGNGNKSGHVRVFELPLNDSTPVSDTELIINIFPNPTSQLLNVQLSEDVNTLYISDVNGKILRSYIQIEKGIKIINLEGFLSGIYFLHARSIDSKSISKFIKI